MPDVGVHRLTAGDDQHERTQNQQRLEPTRVKQKLHAVNGIKCRENLRMVADLNGAQHGDDDKPDEKNGTKYNAYSRRALELDRKQPRQQPDRDRYDEVAQGRRCHFKPFHGRDYADRRRDHSVAEQ
jgi:hypothetical protein